MISNEDIYALKEFVSKVGSDIDLIVTKTTIIDPELESLYTLIKGAWAEVTPCFTEMIEYLEGKRHLEKMDDQLESKGLTGVQLELKLKVFKLRREEFHKAWNDFIDSSENERKNKRPSLKRILLKLLRIIDCIFDSLGFIPGADAAKEIKGVLEELI